MNSTEKIQFPSSFFGREKKNKRRHANIVMIRMMMACCKVRKMGLLRRVVVVLRWETGNTQFPFVP